jgi:hypothetical protein
MHRYGGALAGRRALLLKWIRPEIVRYGAINIGGQLHAEEQHTLAAEVLEKRNRRESLVRRVLGKIPVFAAPTRSAAVAVPEGVRPQARRLPPLLPRGGGR